MRLIEFEMMLSRYSKEQLKALSMMLKKQLKVVQRTTVDEILVLDDIQEMINKVNLEKQRRLLNKLRIYELFWGNEK